MGYIVGLLFVLIGSTINVWSFFTSDRENPGLVIFGLILIMVGTLCGVIEHAADRIINNQNAINAQNNPKTTTKSVSGS